MCVRMWRAHACVCVHMHTHVYTCACIFVCAHARVRSRDLPQDAYEIIGDPEKRSVFDDFGR